MEIKELFACNFAAIQLEILQTYSKYENIPELIEIMRNKLPETSKII